MNDDLDISAGPPISAGLRSALRDVVTRERLEVPAAVDAAIRAAARGPRGRLIRLRRALGAAAAALLLAVGVGVALRGDRAEDARDGVVALDPGDLDRDGRVDIVDAYLLHRSLASEPVLGDVDGDGRIDGVDVRRLIERIVALEGTAGGRNG